MVVIVDKMRKIRLKLLGQVIRKRDTKAIWLIKIIYVEKSWEEKTQK